MAILNLRSAPPSESLGQESSSAEEVASIRRMLDSGEPPGLGRIRRFVLKPRPRLWRFGVGVWLWLARIWSWFVRFLQWLGNLAVRLARAARLAAFLGRRFQNFGARVGAVGRNWSSAEGRLGAAGGRLARVGARWVERGAAFAQVGEGVSELTSRAARFLTEAQDAVSDPAVPGKASEGGAASAPPPKRRGRRRNVSAPEPTQTPTPGGPCPGPVAGRSPASAPPPAGGAAPAAPPPGDPEPTSAADDPPLLPDDLPFHLRNRIEHLGKRPRREKVERLIVELTEDRGWMEPGQLADWLGMTVRYLSRRYLGPLTEAGRLVRRYPNRPTHPDQAYRSARGGAARDP